MSDKIAKNLNYYLSLGKVLEESFPGQSSRVFEQFYNGWVTELIDDLIKAKSIDTTGAKSIANAVLDDPSSVLTYIDEIEAPGIAKAEADQQKRSDKAVLKQQKRADKATNKQQKRADKATNKQQKRADRDTLKQQKRADKATNKQQKRSDKAALKQQKRADKDALKQRRSERDIDLDYEEELLRLQKKYGMGSKSSSSKKDTRRRTHDKGRRLGDAILGSDDPAPPVS